MKPRPNALIRRPANVCRYRRDHGDGAGRANDHERVPEAYVRASAHGYPRLRVRGGRDRDGFHGAHDHVDAT